MCIQANLLFINIYASEGASIFDLPQIALNIRDKNVEVCDKEKEEENTGVILALRY